MQFSRSVVVAVLALLAGVASAQAPRLYLIPGTGADHRLFHALDLADYDTANVRLPVPLRGETMATYAARVAEQIDTTRPFALLGVSLGGMIATELAEQLDPEATVIVSSAKSRYELPATYRFNRSVPVHALVGGRTMRWFTKRAQPRMEPMAPTQRDLFMEMLYAKDPAFVKGAVRLICGWTREEAPPGVLHVHGELDRTLPYRFADPTWVVRGAGHMLTYAQPEVVEWALGVALGAPSL